MARSLLKGLGEEGYAVEVAADGPTGAGNDQLDGDGGNDTLNGGAGDDFLSGDAGRDQLFGGDGDDDLDGGSGNDEAVGDAGNDRVRGGAGSDTVNGSDSDDVIRGGKGRDHLAGGAGVDAFDDAKTNELSTDRDGNDVSDTSVSVAISALPSAVRSAFAGAFRGSKLREIERDAENSVVVCKLDYISDADARRRAVFTDAGVLIRNGGAGGNDGEEIAVGDLPGAVANAFAADFPGATMTKIEREIEGRGLVFEIDFLDAQSIRKSAEYTEAGVLIDVDIR